MHHREMEDIIDDVVAQIKQLRETKGKEYATEEDTLADFKEIAEEEGITPLQVWGVYAKKHMRAIDTFRREGGVKSESIELRVVDVIVYHLLLLGLIRDAPIVVQPDTACGKWYQIVDPSPHGHHTGEFVQCELVKGHDNDVDSLHYGRTPQGHGFRFRDEDVWDGPVPAQVSP